MKFLITLILVVNTLFGINLTNKYIAGDWEMRTFKAASVTFAKTTVDNTISLNFDRFGIVKNKYTNDNYYYKVMGNKIFVSEFEPTRKNKLILVDEIEIVGEVDGCLIAKYTKKRISGVYNKKDFKLCKLRNEPLYIKTY